MARTATSDREGVEARARILAAAHEVFASRGFRAATLDAIARRAGLSRAGVLHHFTNKQALLVALLDARDAELHLAENQHRRDTANELLIFMQGSMQHILDGRDLVRLAHMLTAEAADADHPAHEWLVARSRRLRASMATAFQASFDRGELRGGVDPKVLAALCLGCIEGLEAQWLADPGEVNVAEGMALFETLVRSALA